MNRLLLLVSTLILCAGCSGGRTPDDGDGSDTGGDAGPCTFQMLPTLAIAASPTTQAVQAGNFITLTITGTSRCAPLVDGSVTLTTDYGSFEKPAAVDPSVADDVRSMNDPVIAGHAVTVRLYADPTPGTAHVNARFADSSGNSVTASMVLEFTAAPEPSAVQNLHFACLTYNIGVLDSEVASLQLPCSATATDANDHSVSGSDIRFLAEAGTMKYENGHLYYFPRDPSAHHASPRDVSPEDLAGSAEPFRTGSGGHVFNPRDGLVTIVAYAYASQAAVAAQGLSEPFVDSNDNQTFDEGEDYLDLNGDRTWNESQDDDAAQPHAIWRKIKVLWTGALQNASPVAAVDPSFADVGYLQNQTFTFSVLDQNYNVLAANDPANDVIQWAYSPQPDIALASGQTASTKLFNSEDPRRLGMLMDANFDFVDPTSPFNWKMGGAVTVVVQDTMQCNTPLLAEQFTVVGDLYRSLFLSADGDPLGLASETTLPAGGSLEPPPAANCAD